MASRARSTSPTPIQAEDLESGTFRKSRPRILDASTVRMAMQLKARVARPKPGPLRISHRAIALPDALLVLEDGTVIAMYDGEPLLRYRNLRHLSEQQGIDERDLEWIERIEEGR